MTKICYLADASSSHTVKWCEFFKEKGYDVYVISLNKGDIKGVKVYSFNFDIDSIKNENIVKKLKYISCLKEIKTLIKKINPDIVHAHYASSYGFIGSLLGFRPYIISVWGTDIYEFPKKSIIHKSIMKYNFKKADLIFSTSKAMAKETKLYTKKDIYITPFGVELDFFKPMNNVKKDNSKLVIGTIKTLENRYGIDYLIKAFKVIKDECNQKNISLVIGGSGSKKEKLQDQVKRLGLEEHVSFIGRVPKEDLVNTFNSFDIAVFPSLKESFGVAAVEAQACGVPVVATNIGGLPEATAPNKSSILVDSENVEQLADAIMYLIYNEEKRNEMGMYGREYVKNRFNLNDNFNKVDKIYKNILNKKN